MQPDFLPSQAVHADSKPPAAPVASTVTFGLAAFALVLGLAGFGFRLAMGEHWQSIVPNLLLTGSIFWLGLPLGFVVGAKLMNRFNTSRTERPIHWRNALTLGLLFSCVAMLWLMSTYS